MDSIESRAKESISDLLGADRGKSSPRKTVGPQDVRNSITDLLQRHYSQGHPSGTTDVDLTDNSSSADDDDDGSFLATDNSSEAADDDPDPSEEAKKKASSDERELETDNSSEEAEDDDHDELFGLNSDNSSEAEEDDEIDVLSILTSTNLQAQESFQGGVASPTIEKGKGESWIEDTGKEQTSNPYSVLAPEESHRPRKAGVEIYTRTSKGSCAAMPVKESKGALTEGAVGQHAHAMQERSEKLKEFDRGNSLKKRKSPRVKEFVVPEVGLTGRKVAIKEVKDLTVESSLRAAVHATESKPGVNPLIQTSNPPSEDTQGLQTGGLGVVMPTHPKRDRKIRRGAPLRRTNSRAPAVEHDETLAEYQKAVEDGLQGQVVLTRPTLLQVIAKAGLWSSIGAFVSGATTVPRVVLKTKDEYSLASSLDLPFRRIVFARLRRALFEALNIPKVEEEYRKCLNGDVGALRYFAGPVVEWDQQRTKVFLEELGGACNLSVDGSDLLDETSPEELHELGLTSQFLQQRFRYQIALHRIRQTRLGTHKGKGKRKVPFRVANVSHAWTLDSEAGLRTTKPVREWSNDDVVDLCTSLGLPETALSRIREFALVGEDLEGLTSELAKDELLVSDLEDRQALLAAIKLISKENGSTIGRCEYFDISYKTEGVETHSHFQRITTAKDILCFHPFVKQCIRFHPRVLFSTVMKASAKRVQVNARVWYRILESKHEARSEGKERRSGSLRRVQLKGAFAICSRTSSFAAAHSHIAPDGERLLRWDPLHDIADTETQIVNGWKLACTYTADKTTLAETFRSNIIPMSFKKPSAKGTFLRFCFMVDFTTGTNGLKRIGNNLFMLSNAFLVKPVRSCSNITSKTKRIRTLTRKEISTTQTKSKQGVKNIIELEGSSKQTPAEGLDIQQKQSKTVAQGKCKHQSSAAKLSEQISVAYHLGRLGTSEERCLNDTAEEVQVQLSYLTADIRRYSGSSSEDSSTSDSCDDSDSSSPEAPSEEDGDGLSSWAERVKGLWQLPLSDCCQITYPYRPSHQSKREARGDEAKAVITLVSKLEGGGLDQFFEILSTYDLSFKGSIPRSSFYQAGVDLGLDQYKWTRRSVSSYWECTSIEYEVAILHLGLQDKGATERKVVSQVLDRLRCRGNFMGVSLDDWVLKTSTQGSTSIALTKPKWREFMSMVQLSCEEELMELVCSKASLEDFMQPLLESYQDALATLRRVFPKGGNTVQNLGRKFEERDTESSGVLGATTFLNVVNFALEDCSTDTGTQQRQAIPYDALLGIALKFGCAGYGVSADAESRSSLKQNILYADFIGKVLLDTVCQKDLYLCRLQHLDLPRLFLQQDMHGKGCVDARLVLCPPFSKAELEFLGLSGNCKYSSWCSENMSDMEHSKELERMEFDRIKRYVNSAGAQIPHEWKTPEEFVEAVLLKLSPFDVNLSGYVHLSQLEDVLSIFVPNVCRSLLFRQYKQQSQSKVDYEEFLLSLCKETRIAQAQRKVVSRLFALVLEREKLNFRGLLDKLESLEETSSLPRRAPTSAVRDALPRSGQLLRRILQLLGLPQAEHISFDAFIYSSTTERDFSELEAEIARSKVRSWQKLFSKKESTAFDTLRREDRLGRGILKLETFAFLCQEAGISWSGGELASLCSSSKESMDYEELLLYSEPSKRERQALGGQILKRNGKLAFDSRKESVGDLRLSRKDARKMELVIQEDCLSWKNLTEELVLKTDASIFQLFLSADGDLDGWISFRSFMLTLSQHHLLREYGDDAVRRLSKTCSISTRQQSVVRYEYFCEDVSGVSRQEYMQERLTKKSCTQAEESKSEFFLKKFGTEKPLLAPLRRWLLREEEVELRQFGENIWQREL